MPVFISYSHQDKEFVNKLAAHLVRHRTHVWVDTWELRAGDSLLTKVQEAIQKASVLLVVLSAASVESEWCKKEVNAGLMRELEEKRVVVLPVLLEECSIPVFLKDKVYADFRSNFDDGLNSVLEAISGATSDSQGRIQRPEFHVDWATDWFYEKELFCLRFTLVEQAVGLPFSVLTEATVKCNERATAHYQRFESEDLGWFGRVLIAEGLGMLADSLHIILEDQFPKRLKVRFGDPKVGFEFDVDIVARRLGEDIGKDILLDLGGHLEIIRDSMRTNLRKPDTSELLRIARIIGTPK